LNLEHRTSKELKRWFIEAMEPWDKPIPTKLLLGNGRVSWFDDNHEKHIIIQHNLKVIICYLVRTLGKISYHHRHANNIIEYQINLLSA
jgi:hypothetical protein